MTKAKLGEVFASHGIADEITSVEERGGGCICSAYVVKTKGDTYFVKTNSVSFLQNFKAEFAGLEKMAETNTILCPKPLHVGTCDKFSYLIMTYLPNLRGPCAEIGAQLAKMHLAGRSDKFGFPIVTYCGSTELDNAMTDEPWSMWFARHRIGKVIEQIGTSRVTKRPLEDVIKRVAELLKDHDKDVKPSLVHGDLWGGNGGQSNGTPCIFDPACYYADPEVDLAMTEMFGGFGSGFYKSYETVTKICPGYDKRKRIYNLFHLLNHGLMFGGGYLSESKSEIESLFR